MTTRPADFPNWASDTNFSDPGNPWDASATKVAPSNGLKASGYVPGALRPAVVDNYLWNLSYQYFGWLVERMAGLILSNWTARDTGVSNGMLCLVYADTLDLWFASFGGAIYRSSDCVNWTTCSAGTGINYIAWGNATLVAVGASGEVQSSTNGTAWTDRTAALGVAEAIYHAAYGDGVWLVVGGNVNGFARYTSDLTTWTAPSTPPSATGIPLRSCHYSSDLDLWVIGGDSGANLWTAPNATTTWTARAHGIAGNPAIRSIVWDGTYFHALGGNAYGAYSSSGTSWSSVEWGPSLCTFRQVIYVPEFKTVVAVGQTTGGVALVRTRPSATNPITIAATDRSPTDPYVLLGVSASSHLIGIATDENTNAKTYTSLRF